MGKEPGKTRKINVTGMTEDQFGWVDKKAAKSGTTRAVIMKGLVTAAMEREEAGYA